MKTPMLEKLNYINVGADATFRKTGKLHTTPEDVDAIFAHLVEHNKLKLAVHFHGGLVSETEGAKTAEMMRDVFLKANAHPVTFIWETGWWEIIRDRFWKVYKRRIFQKILRVVLKIAGEKIGISDTKGEAYISYDYIEEELKKENPFVGYGVQASGKGAALSEALLPVIREEIDYRVEEELEMDMELKTLSKELVEEESGAKGPIRWAKFLFKVGEIAYRVVKRFIQKRDHDLYPTVIEEISREIYIEEIGKFLWDGMKTRAEEMWQSNDGLSGVNQHPGSYFLAQLQTWLQGDSKRSVDFVGHSAGSIAICRMLLAIETLKHTDIRIRQIMFLAPACRTGLFTLAMLDTPARYQQFRMFTMTDSKEKKDVMLKYVYTHSLLYLVSGVLEEEVDEPILGMQRFLADEKPFKKDAALRRLHDYFHGSEQNLISSATSASAPQGFKSGALKHGDFDNDGETQESLIHWLQAE